MNLKINLLLLGNHKMTGLISCSFPIRFLFTVSRVTFFLKKEDPYVTDTT